MALVVESVSSARLVTAIKVNSPKTATTGNMLFDGFILGFGFCGVCLVWRLKKQGKRLSTDDKTGEPRDG